MNLKIQNIIVGAIYVKFRIKCNVAADQSMLI